MFPEQIEMTSCYVASFHPNNSKENGRESLMQHENEIKR